MADPGTKTGFGGLPRDPRQDVRTRRALAKLGGTDLVVDNVSVSLSDDGQLQVGAAGVLGVAHGGTGDSSFVANAVVYANNPGTSPLLSSANFTYTSALGAELIADADGHKALVVKAHSATQSANRVEFGASTGVLDFQSAANGHYAVGPGSQVDTDIFGGVSYTLPATLTVYEHVTAQVGGVTLHCALNVNLTADTAAPSGTYEMIAAFLSATTPSTNSGNFDDLRGVVTQAFHYGAGNVNFLVGDYTVAANAGNGTVFKAYGLLGDAENDGSGVVTNAYGLFFGCYNNSTGSITHGYVYYADGDAGGVGYTDRYGYYCADQSTATASGDNFNFYSAGTGSHNLFAGDVCVGGTAKNVASAVLEADSTTRGFLPPRGTTTQKNAISSPAEALYFYDLSLHLPYYYNGSAWVPFGPSDTNIAYTDVANSFTANQTIDATHHLLLAEMTAGSVLFAGTSGQVSQDNSNLFWDGTNHFLGVGTPAPLAQLTVDSISTAATRGVYVAQHNSGVQAALVTFAKSRGSRTSPTNVSTGDLVGFFTAAPYAAGAYVTDPAHLSFFMSASNKVSAAVTVSDTSGGNYAPSLLIYATGIGAGNGVVGIGDFGNIISGTIVQPGAKLHVRNDSDSQPALILRANSSAPSSPQVQLAGVSSTTSGRTQADIDTAWADSTDASRKARLVLRVWDTAAREAVRAEASGSAALLGFFGTTAAAQQSGDVAAGLVSLGLFSSANYSAAAPLSLFDRYADVANSGTSETTLYSDGIGAARLATNGDKVLAQYGGAFAGAVSATQELKIYFGPNGSSSDTVLFDTGALAIGGAVPSFGAQSWQFQVTLIRASSSIVRVTVEFTSDVTALAAATVYTKVTGLTLTNQQYLTVTGTAGGAFGGSNQITATMGYGQFVPHA